MKLMGGSRTLRPPPPPPLFILKTVVNAKKRAELQRSILRVLRSFAARRLM